MLRFPFKTLFKCFLDQYSSKNCGGIGWPSENAGKKQIHANELKRK